MVLSVAATPLAQRLGKCDHIEQARIWTWPYQVAAMRFGGDAPEERALAQQLDPFIMGMHEQRVHRADEDDAAPDKNQVIVRERISYPLWSGRLRHFQGKF